MDVPQNFSTKSTDRGALAVVAKLVVIVAATFVFAAFSSKTTQMKPTADPIPAATKNTQASNPRT